MNRSSFSDTATGRPLRPLLAAVLAAFALAACSNTSNVASGANAEGLLKASAAAAQAVTLSDADVMQLADKSCAEMDAKAKVASAKGKSAQRLARLVKGMPKEVEGVTLNYKVYETREINAWAMNNGCDAAAGASAARAASAPIGR